MEEITAVKSEPPLLSFALTLEQISDDGPNVLAVDLQRVIDDCLGFLVTGSSGSGKSHLVRGILEQTHGRVQQIIVDTEGEYVTLREKFDYLVAARGGGDIPLAPQTAAILCRRVMELNISVILDIYELEPRERQAYVAAFLKQLIETPLEHRRPVFVAIPEVHLYAPQGPSTDAKEAVRDLVARGRKRGIMPIFDTQSVAKTDKTALEAIRNKLVGYIELDVHLDRAAAELGLRGEDREQLRRLPRGTFFAQGPALSRTVTLVRTGDNLTHAPKMGAGLAAMPTLPTPAAIQEILSLFGDLPEQAAEEAKTIEEARDRIAVLESKLALATGAGGSTGTIAESTTTAAAAPGRMEVEVPVLSPEQLDALAKASAMMLEGANSLLTIGRDLQQTGAQISAGLTKWAAAVNAVDSVETPESFPAPATPIPQGIDGPTPSKPPVDRPASNEAGAVVVVKPAPAPPKRTSQRSPEGTVPAPEAVESPPPPASPTKLPALSSAQQTIVDTMASFAAMGVPSPAKSNVAALAGFSSRSGSYSANCTRLRELGLVKYFGNATMALTPEGVARADNVKKPASRKELVAAWKARLTRGQATILDLLVEQKGKSLTRAEIARRAGLSPNSGSFSASLTALKDLGLIHYPVASSAAATDLLFPKGLRD